MTGTATESLSRGMKGLATLPDLLRWRADREADRLGYRFLEDGESREVTLTYGELHRRARAIAAVLQSHGATGERVLLVYPPGLDFICAWFGCAYAGAISIAVPPQQPSRPLPFIAAVSGIASEATPIVALTTASILESLPTLEGNVTARVPRWIPAEGDMDETAVQWQDPATTGDDLAFLQYTSGSTRSPRGVMVTHANLMDNLHAIGESFWRSSLTGSVIWLPPFHDMGLIGGIFGPLYVGSPVTLLSPTAFLQRPHRWLHAIARFGASVSGGPNFAYDLCVRRISPEKRVGLDLSEWRVAFTGAEPVNAETLAAFTERFAPCGFRPEAFTPCYGLAESTLLVAAHEMTEPPRVRTFNRTELEHHRIVECDRSADDVRTLISCGRPSTTTLIVDPDTRAPCPPRWVGEIWVSGPSVAKGYWNQPTETKHAFDAHLAGVADGSFLRTGDLGFLFDGELFVTGRLKDLIIIDGRNHYPQDIELTVGDSHPAFEPTDCAAFSVDRGGREALVVVAAVRGSPDRLTDDLPAVIRTAVAELHDLRVHDVVLVRRGGVPKTTSGKIRRSACRTAYHECSLSARRPT